MLWRSTGLGRTVDTVSNIIKIAIFLNYMINFPGRIVEQNTP